MSERDRGFEPAFVVFGIVICAIAVYWTWNLSAEQTEIRVRGEQNAAQHIEYAEERIERTCLDLDRPALIECIHEQYQAARDHSRAERDLDAQQAMALWTKLMVFVSIGAAALTLVGLYFVWRTLKASEAATEAALAAVEVTRDIGEKQVRAYLAPGMKKWFIDKHAEFLVNNGEEIAIKVQLTLENVGQSPANEITHRTFCGIRAGRLSEDDDLSIVLADEANIFSLGPKASSKGDIHFVTRAELNEIFEGRAFCYLFGIATYRDVFSKSELHITKHAYELRYDRNAVDGPGFEFFGFGGETNNRCT